MPKQTNLHQAIAKLETQTETKNFLRDLLTPAEITEFETRFDIATLLWTTNLSYAKIAKKLKTSTTTVTRVARFLYKEPHRGYALILKRLHGKSVR
ncbi:MAG: YerC/YecD family TrpR-related protein [Patescibacteria group bacterium]